jgi:outer membrane protein
VTETTEGKAAQAKLDQMYDAKKKEIETMQTDIQKAYQDYQSRQAILSDQAKAQVEQELMRQQQTFERTYMQYQNEMQQSYMQMLQGLDKKMRALTQTLGKEKGYDLVVDKAVVVYAGGATTDITKLLIDRYNAQ